MNTQEVPMTRRSPSAFERLLFGATRLFSLVTSLACLAAIAIALSLVSVLLNSADTHVSYANVALALKAPTDQQATSTGLKEALPDFEIPAKVQQYLGGSNEKVLLGWIEPLDPDQRKDFLINLAEVIGDAEHQSANVIDAVNKYKELKLGKLRTGTVDKYASQAAEAALVGFIGLMVLLLAILSLVLVLLSIERNTRGLSPRAADA